MSESIKIGNVQIAKTAALAPMASIRAIMVTILFFIFGFFWTIVHKNRARRPILSLLLQWRCS